jgi:tetratricopeptide (TPR) repeat protein
MHMKLKFMLLVACLAAVSCGKSYEELLQSGMEQRKAQKWADAKQTLFSAAEKKQTAEVYKELGNVFLLGEQNLGEAEGYYKKALGIDATYINAEFNMAVVALKKYELTLDDSGKGNEALLDEADKWFKKVYTQNPNFGVGIEEMAKYYYYRRNYKAALETAQKAIAVDNRNSNAYSVTGQIYYSGIKDYKQAFENFEQARSLNNKDTDIVYFLWATSEKLKKPQDAAQFKTRYEQMLKQEGLAGDQAKDRVKRLENQLRGG